MIRRAYAYRDLLQQNSWIANGTDFLVENISPVLSFYAAVAWQDVNGNPPSGFRIENCLLREDALRSITIWAARAGFDDEEMGSLEPDPYL
jgi:predicted amidohydrolase YtcJ